MKHILQKNKNNKVKSKPLEIYDLAGISHGLETYSIHLVVEPLLTRRLLGDALNHPLELGDGRVLLGIEEEGRLLAPDHEEHVHLGGCVVWSSSTVVLF
jgi:hypothetical protein